MKINFVGKLCVILLIINICQSNKDKQQSRFDRAYKECSSKGECSNRPNDEGCVLNCISPNCYNQIYGNDYIYVFGEINYELKGKFEGCYNKRKE